MEQTVFFPGLGLSFTMNRVAFRVFGHPIYWYGIIIAVGFLLAVWFCLHLAWDFGVEPDWVVDMLLFAVPLSILGARVYYVVFYLSQFTNPDGSFNWGKAVAIWDGGIAVYGSIIAAVLTVVVFCRARKLNAWAMMDVGCYGLLIGQAVGRWGNFVNIEVFGKVTGLPWRMCGKKIADWLWEYGHIDSAENYNAIVEGTLGVHPTFFYESVWNVTGFILLVILAKKWRKCDGQMFLSYVVWYGLGRFWIEGIRTDTLFFFQTGIKVSQMLALLSAAAGTVMLVWRLRHAPPASAALARPKDGRS